MLPLVRSWQGDESAWKWEEGIGRSIGAFSSPGQFQHTESAEGGVGQWGIITHGRARAGRSKSVKYSIRCVKCTNRLSSRC